MIKGIHHIAIHTPDLERTSIFYRDAFGFVPVGEVFEWQGSVEIDAALGVSGSRARTQMLNAGNCFIEVFQYASPPSRVKQPLAPNDRGYTHFAIDVIDIEAEMVRLEQLGMRFASGQPLDGGTVKSVYGYDLDGNVVELQELSVDHPAYAGLSKIDSN